MKALVRLLLSLLHHGLIWRSQMQRMLTVGQTYLFLTGHPGTLARVALPYILSGAVLGRLLAERPSSSPGQVAA